MTVRSADVGNEQLKGTPRGHGEPGLHARLHRRAEHSAADPRAHRSGPDPDTPGVRFFSDPATSSKIPALRRAGFQELAGYTRLGDALTVSELYRLAGTWPTSSRSASGASSTA